MSYYIGVVPAGDSNNWPELVHRAAAADDSRPSRIRLGRGGGRDVDDDGYLFDSGMYVHSGLIAPSSDLAEVSTMVGIDVLCNYSRQGTNGDSLLMWFRWDGAANYTQLLNEVESGSGSGDFATSGWEKVSGYAATNNMGHFLETSLVGSGMMTGTADAAVTTTDTTLTDTRFEGTRPAPYPDALVGLVVTCNGKEMTILSHEDDTLTGSGWSGGGNPGNGKEWYIDGLGGVGSDRASIREAWAHGYTHQTHTDVISLGIWAIDGAEVNGRMTGMSRDECVRKWRDWQNRGVELLLEMEGYERGRNTRVLVKKVEVLNALATPGKHPGTTALGDQVKVQLVRVDRSNQYAE